MSAPKVTFDQAAEAFVELVARVDADRWDEPGLGEWSVRDLVGHASRALLTVEAYLGIAPQPGARRVLDPASYYRAAMSSIGDPAMVAQRGRDAGAALGDDPVRAITDLAGRVRTLVASTPDRAEVGTPVGVMALVDYLPTRTFELVVHSLDLADAVGLEHRLPSGAVDEAVELATALAVAQGHGAEVLRALTGRRPLPEGFSLL